MVPRPHHRCPPGARPRSRCILTGRRPVSSTGQITQASGPLLPGEGTPGSEVACRVGDRPSRRRLVSQLSATAVLGRKGRPGHGDPPRPGVCGWMCPALEISHRALHGVLSSATHSLTPLGDPLQERKKLKSSCLVCHRASWSQTACAWDVVPERGHPCPSTGGSVCCRRDVVSIRGAGRSGGAAPGVLPRCRHPSCSVITPVR